MEVSAFSHIRSYDWLVFTSPAGVEVFFRQMEKKKIDLRSLGNAKIAVIGEGTKKKFLERGIYLFMMEIPLEKSLALF